MRTLIALAALCLASCGFQLRGAAKLPFDTVYVGAAGGGIALDLKRNIQAGTNVKVVDDPKKAEALLQFTQEQRQKDILSLDAAGRVNSFKLRYTVSFRVVDSKGGDFVPPSTIVLTRDILFNNAEVLAEESEEQLLYRDMQRDMVQQIMRRLAAAKRPAKA
ncbi:MAG TPA: LPS assembly lipoprotein LptE [Burkholderiales bacterium]|nr:LPS assembly lipoprotein LptE [Burkholderiales bacterium]